MKKIIFIFSFFILTFLGLILFISTQRTDNLKEKYYAIRHSRSYTYDDTSKITIQIYSNQKKSWISYVNTNQYFLENQTITIQLNHIKVEEVYDCKVNGEVFYQYKIQADMPNPLDSVLYLNQCHIKIKNEAKTLVQDIGHFSIYPPYKRLNIVDLYGNYSYIDEELYLIGITLCLKNSFNFLQKVSFGEAFSNLKYVESNQMKDSQMDALEVVHPIIDEQTESVPIRLNAPSGFYFIPFSYPIKQLITEGSIQFMIDNETYYIENFCYLSNEIHLNEYLTIRLEGKINEINP